MRPELGLSGRKGINWTWMRKKGRICDDSEMFGMADWVDEHVLHDPGGAASLERL